MQAKVFLLMMTLGWEARRTEAARRFLPPSFLTVVANRTRAQTYINRSATVREARCCSNVPNCAYDKRPHGSSAHCGYLAEARAESSLLQVATSNAAGLPPTR